MELRGHFVKSEQCNKDIFLLEFDGSEPLLLHQTKFPPKENYLEICFSPFFCKLATIKKG